MSSNINFSDLYLADREAVRGEMRDFREEVGKLREEFSGLAEDVRTARKEIADEVDARKKAKERREGRWWAVMTLLIAGAVAFLKDLVELVLKISG